MMAVALVAAATALARTDSDRALAAASGPHGATFVGAQTCASCHREKFETWKGGRHSRMIQPATAASVEGDFGVARVTLHGRPYRLRAADGQFFITESYLSGREQEHRVEYTLGSRRIQHYLATIDNGRIVILPPSWDAQRHEWFDNMDIVRPDEDDRLPVQQWNKNCFGCHVSGQENHYDPSTRTYATRWTDFGTSCERCHGPGSAHVAAYAPGADPALPKPAIVKATRLDPVRGTMVCAQCHSLRDAAAPGFAAGADYYDYFMPVLEYGPLKKQDPAYWADGRPRRFSNDAIGFWESQCFLRGGATCTTCHHDPHQPDVDRDRQLASAKNLLCTRCHREIGAATAAHTRHAPDSPGSACVECHMPKTVVSIRSAMRDHTIGVPAPENTVRFGIPNACNECHKDRSAKWAADAVSAWQPGVRRAKLIDRAQTFTEARAARPEALDRLIAIAADETAGPLIQANAVGYLGNYADPRTVTALRTAAASGHPAIRLAAIASLGRLSIGVSRPLLMAALDDSRRTVRVRALIALFDRAAGPFTPAEDARVRRVSDEFAEQARMNEDDGDAQRDLGLVKLLLGEFDASAHALEISLGLQPDRVTLRYLLALARLGQRRVGDARTLLQQVGATDPSYHAAQERLRTIAKDHGRRED